MKRILTALIFSMLAALPVSAVDSVTGTPATITIPETGNALVTIRWRVQFTSSAPLVAPLVLTGATGTVSTGDISNDPISRTTNFAGGGTTTVTVLDRIRIDRATALAISTAGTATFSRVFSNSVDSLTATGIVTLQVGKNAALGFREFDLSFDNNSQFKTVGIDEALTAKVEISSTGTGQLRGTWEVAGPDNGNAFRILEQTSVSLAGNRRTTIESPALPTDRNGIYLVRFLPEGRQSSVPLGSDTVIRYVVAGPSSNAAFDLISPSAGARLASTTEFNWAPVEGAVGYRIEFILPGILTQRRLAGKDIAGTSARLGPLSINKLADQGDVSWRVIAYDSAGREIAKSTSRKIGTN